MTGATSDNIKCNRRYSEKVIPQEFVCPLTLEIMKRPIMTRWGHNFEREALLTWMEKHNECPLTRNPITLSDVIVNRNLQNRIDMWRRETGLVMTTETMEDSHPPFYLPVKSKRLSRLLNKCDRPSSEAIAETMRKRSKQPSHCRKRRTAVAC